MGNCGSNAITIDLNRANMFYFTGETVIGTASLYITDGKLEADELFITLTSEIGYMAYKTVTINKGEIGTQAKRHYVPFYSAKVSFERPDVRQRELVYSQGRYSWPFQIPLTNQLPPTINEPHLFPHVRYYLQVLIDKPWYEPNTRETKYITIYPKVNLLQNPQCLQSIIFGNHNRKDITLKGTLNKTGYVPHELIIFTLETENQKRVFIRKIDMSMLQSYRIGQNSRENIIFQITLPKIVNLKDEQINETFPLMIPSASIPR